MMNKPKIVKSWEELKECKSETYRLEIDVEMCSGWIISNNKNNEDYYLSTHTFYGSTHKFSTEILQKCGFNVQLTNWDE